MKLNCIIADDEPLARKGIKAYVNKTTFLNFCGEADSAAEAATFLHNAEIDLIFLDIQMPEISGVEFVRSLDKNVLIIFITAFSEYAIEGYELNVIDYLLKPIRFNRFLKAVNKLNQFTQQTINQAMPVINSERKSFFFNVGNFIHHCLINS